MTALDEQIGGIHYKNFAIQPVEFIHRNGIDFLSGNIIKYVCRWKSKGGLNDLEKAKHYIELLIELSANKYNEYCRNCTDINEGVFVKKLDCECQKVDKSVPCVNCRNIFGVCGLGGICKCANAACKCQKENKND